MNYEFQIREYAGYWVIGGHMGLKFAVQKKPRWITRIFAKLLFEWEWEDMQKPLGDKP